MHHSSRWQSRRPCYRDLPGLQAPSGKRSLQLMILPTDERTLFVAINTDEASDAYEWTCTKFRRGGRSEDELKYLWDTYCDLKERSMVPR